MFLLVLNIGLSAIGGSEASVFSVVASRTCRTFALGTCSGVHFNFAVAIDVAAAGPDECYPKDAGIHITAQIIAGIAVRCTHCAVEGDESLPSAPGKGRGWAEAVVAESMFTAWLVFVVLSDTTVEQPFSEHLDIATGSCITTGGYAIGAVSGGCSSLGHVNDSHAVIGEGRRFRSSHITCLVMSLAAKIAGPWACALNGAEGIGMPADRQVKMQLGHLTAVAVSAVGRR